MSAEPNPRTLTEDEYLALERLAETQSEFFNGEMFAMSGASPKHNLIAGNLLSSLSSMETCAARAALCSSQTCG